MGPAFFSSLAEFYCFTPLLSMHLQLSVLELRWTHLACMTLLAETKSHCTSLKQNELIQSLF
jgi:hypothetical protein